MMRRHIGSNNRGTNIIPILLLLVIVLLLLSAINVPCARTVINREQKKTAETEHSEDETVEPHHTPDGPLHEHEAQPSSAPCISSLTDCDLDCLDWTIVLSMGRSGSTTVQQMISKLPGMNMFGEEGGLLDNFSGVQGVINRRKKTKGIAWLGAQDANVRTTACMVQKFYSERHGVECLHRGCRHGFKETRYLTKSQIEWIRTVFPKSKIVVNYRSECDNYKDKFGRWCGKSNKERDDFLQVVEDVSGVLHMELEQLNNLTKWRELSKFIGYDNCTALSVASANTNRSYTKRWEAADYNPWSCLQSDPC